jgi:NAD(P)H-flavin reductase
MFGRLPFGHSSLMFGRLPFSQLAKILICGPPGMVKHLAGELPSKKGQGELGGVLKQMGFEASQVFKF